MLAQALVILVSVLLAASSVFGNPIRETTRYHGPLFTGPRNYSADGWPSEPPYARASAAGHSRHAHDRLDASDAALECGLRQLAAAAAPVMPRRPEDLAEALELDRYCQGDRTELKPDAQLEHRRMSSVEALPEMNHSQCVHFSAMPGEKGLLDAIEQARKNPSACKTVRLGPGTTFLKHTLKLGPRDQGIRLIGASADPGSDREGQTCLSGGIPIEVASVRVPVTKSGIVTVTIPVPPSINAVPGLFALNPHVRFQAARWPNGNTERDQWGYASPLSGKVSVRADQVKEWTAPRPIKPPQFSFIDLADTGNPTGFAKTDSAMREYNTYTSGRGGSCDATWDTSYGSSYWCGNNSAGGWAEVDKAFALDGTVGIPVGLEYYRGSEVGRRIESWADPAGAIVHAWHGQSWFTNMFQVNKLDRTTGRLEFGRGGSQGGRSWCRCDQCSYAGRWCRPTNDTRLVSGTWYVENVAEELDQPGEFYFDRRQRVIRLVLNQTSEWFEMHPDNDGMVALKELVLIVPHLKTLVHIENATDVTVSHLCFRDAQRTFLEKHGVPSGGDWSLYKGAAMVIENSSKIAVLQSQFTRLDGTALLLLDRTRHVRIAHSEFAWLGESAMAAWGRTEEWDGRDGRQPRQTVVEHNVVREIGIYEKQSSAWFQAKACQTVLQNNLFFNLPRAAINFNDGFGGGNLVQRNVMFNTCRESGDHGAINSWDRQPFLWDETGRFGFDTPPTIISRNLILANYGASQGVDNDDGSSFYHINDNVFWGDGFKMDYGGHDSNFHGNLVVVRPYDGQNCFNVANFNAGHAHQFTMNQCVILGCRGGCEELVGTYAGCADAAAIVLENNHYYTRAGNATIKCDQHVHRLAEVQAKFGKEGGSSAGLLPSTPVLLSWAKERVRSWSIVEVL